MISSEKRSYDRCSLPEIVEKTQRKVSLFESENLLTPARIDYDRVVRVDNERCEYLE